MAAAGLTFFSGDDSAPGCYVFPRYDDDPSNIGGRRFEGWIDRWMSVLEPRTVDSQRAIHLGKASNDEYMDLCYDAQRFGYLIGYFVGCRSTGATDADMRFKFQVFKQHFLPWAKSWIERKAKNNEQAERKADQEAKRIWRGIVEGQ